MSGIASKYRQDILVISTAIGLIATFSAPWLELEGVFQSWRIVEWNTFWQGSSAYLLNDIVAANYPVPIEFAQPLMREAIRAVVFAGTLLAIWHLGAALALVSSWVFARQLRVRLGRALLETIPMVLLACALLLALNRLLTIPSNLSLKVDFRTPSDMHSTSLVWSQVSFLPVAPVFSITGWVVQAILLAKALRGKQLWFDRVQPN